MINTVNKLRKFQCLNNGFDFLEFKSNCLNDDDSLHIELLYNDPHFIQTSFSFNNADFLPLSSKSSLVNSFDSLQFWKLNSNFSTLLKSLLPSLLKSNNSLLPLGTSSTQNSCFSPNTHKSSVASAPV